MQKSGIALVISGILVIMGLILLVVGNQVILEGINQENGITSINQDLIISNEFAADELNSGAYVVQILEFKEDTFSAKILDPSDIEISSHSIDSETVEKEFDVEQSGTYKLIVQSNSDEQTHVFAAIGPLPDAAKKSLGFLSLYVLIVGIIGLAVSGIYGFKNRKRSI